jgi:peptidoglycan hydrolase CwlO-like protein
MWYHVVMKRAYGILAFFGFCLASMIFMGPVPHVLADDSISDIQDDIAGAQERLEKAETRTNALAGELSQINVALSRTQSAIASAKEKIAAATNNIDRKEAEIELMEERIEENRLVLTGLLRRMKADSDDPFSGALLSEGDATSALDNPDRTRSVGDRIRDILDDMRSTRDRVSQEKRSLEDLKQEHEGVLAEKLDEKSGLVESRTETQGDLAEQQATVAELRAKLAELQSDMAVLTGKAYDAKDIREAVEFASKRTGVPKGVLLGFLRKETNLGADTGKCTYKDVEKVSVAGYKKYGQEYQASIDRLYNRWKLFKGIVKDLGYSESKKISCTIPFSKAGPNQGGAMGVAQFMSDTWLGWEPQIRAQTGHSKPDPWNLTDGVMGMALKVKSAGGTSDSKSAIRKATINYYGAFSQGYYDTVVYWSKNYKKLFD